MLPKLPKCVLQVLKMPCLKIMLFCDNIEDLMFFFLSSKPLLKDDTKLAFNYSSVSLGSQ